MSSPWVPPFYYPTNESQEADAAYAAWRAHYAAQQPMQMACYETPAYSTWQCQPIPQPAPAMACYPVNAAPTSLPPGWTYEMPKKKAKKDESSSEESDSDDEMATYYCLPTSTAPQAAWVVDGEKKKKKKELDMKDVEHVMHYVPAGLQPPPDGMYNGKYHYSFIGRSAQQVAEDRHQQALDAGVYKPRAKIPDAKKDDKLWVVNGKTGEATLESFGHIREKFKGEWKVDPKYGNDFFVKKGEKNPMSWDSD